MSNTLESYLHSHPDVPIGPTSRGQLIIDIVSSYVSDDKDYRISDNLTGDEILSIIHRKIPDDKVRKSLFGRRVGKERFTADLRYKLSTSIVIGAVTFIALFIAIVALELEVKGSDNFHLTNSVIGVIQNFLDRAAGE